MKKFITFIGQMHANLILRHMESAKCEETLNYWFERGKRLNNFMISYEIYLD